MNGTTAPRRTRGATNTGPCPADGCTLPISTNGHGCHDHFVERVPPFLRRALFARHDPFTTQWLAAQARHAIRKEPYSA